jgi:hypothetical protein
MESIWVYALVAFFVAITVGGGDPSFLGVAATVMASFAISRGLQGSDLSLGLLRIWGSALSILVFYAIVRVDFYGDWRFWDLGWLDGLFTATEATVRDEATAVIGVPALLGFWIRGVLRGQQPVTFDDVVRSFAFGVVVVAFVAMFAGVVDELPRGVDYVVVPYIGIGLLAIGLAHAARASDEFERSFAPLWLLAVGGAVVGLGLFALLFVVVDFDTAQSVILWVARGIGVIFAGLFYVVVWPVMKLVELGFGLIQYLTELWGGDRPEEVGFGEPPLPEAEEARDSVVPGWVRTATRIAVGGGLVAAFLIGMALLFTRFRKEPPPGELKESTYAEGRLASDLGSLLGSVLGRLRPNLRFGGGEADPARRLYFDMLTAASQRGVERRPMETPLELSPRLERTFAPTTPAEITRLFDDSRYGHLQAPPEEVRRLREDWDRLQK